MTNNIIEFQNKDFNVKHIFECGQAFRWYAEDDGSYTVVAFGRVINVFEKDGLVKIKNTSEDDFEKIWTPYFDLSRSYGDIKAVLPQNPDLDKAKEYGYGIRILKQEEFETIISFIISANNMIPRIKSSIEKLSFLYGEKIGEDEKRAYYSFPKMEVLAGADPLEIREKARVGFRDVRIVEASRMLMQDDYSLDKLWAMDTPALEKKLIDLPGVGPKVANCILLFAFQRFEVFPVDVWIKRVMEELFIHKEVKPKEIGKFAKDLFGPWAGMAQQYLFYYGRDNAIGK